MSGSGVFLEDGREPWPLLARFASAFHARQRRVVDVERALSGTRGRVKAYWPGST